MKRLSVIALSLILLLSLAGCGGNPEENAAGTDAVAAGAVSFTADTVFEDGAVVTVETLTSGENFERAKTAIASISEQFTVYDFNATKDGEKVQPNGKLTVTFRIPEGYGDNVGVYYIPESGAAEEIPTVVDTAAGTATAELEHFSIYLIALRYEPAPVLPNTTAGTTSPTTTPSTAKATTKAPTKAPTTAATVKATAAPTTPKTNAVSTVNPAGYKDNYYYVADLQEVTGGLVRCRLLFEGEYCVVMRYGYSSNPDEGNYPYEYNGKTYYGVGEGQSPGSFELTDTEILITTQNEGTVVIKTVLQSDGTMKVTYSDVEYFYVGQILKPQAQ